MGVALENETLEKRPVQVKSIALFNRQLIVVDFRA